MYRSILFGGSGNVECISIGAVTFLDVVDVAFGPCLNNLIAIQLVFDNIQLGV